MTHQQTKINITSTSGLPAAAKALLDAAGEQKIFLFYGSMGAGKTTFIKTLCRQLGVYDVVTSPTFSIVNEYAGTDGKIFHFDFYRLKTQTEALDMGYEEYFYSRNYCFIEWPEKVPDLLPPHYIKVSLQITGQQSREISFQSI